MRRFLPLLIGALLLVCCKEPVSREYFVKGDGPYEFTVVFTDTSALYAVDLYSRIDAKPSTVPSSAALTLSWISPEDSLETETVYLPLREGGIYHPYRKALVPARYGRWRLVAAFEEAVPGIRGLGIVVRKEWEKEN